ncbi:MAG: hypothetical protein ACYS8Z_22570, partial [Planctomycetota bacterium]
MFNQRGWPVIVLMVVCGIWAQISIAGPPVIYVNARCGNDAWTGLTAECSGPDGCKKTIQAAIDAAPDGGIVSVEWGDYKGEGNRDIDFRGKALKLVGGECVYDCIIDCEGTPSDPHRAFNFHSGETATSTVERFTIINGCAYKGGAVLCTGSSPKFLHCIFQNNEATDDDTGGGAVYNEDSSPIFEKCDFWQNQ